MRFLKSHFEGVEPGILCARDPVQRPLNDTGAIQGFTFDV